MCYIYFVPWNLNLSFFNEFSELWYLNIILIIIIIKIVAISLIALFLLASSGLMLYGVVQKMSWLLLPWMVLHLAAVIGSIIFCSIKFHDLRGQRAIPILGTAIQAYFFLLVFGHYVELRKINLQQPREDQEAATVSLMILFHTNCLLINIL